MEFQIKVYNKFIAKLNELKDMNSKLVFDYEDPSDNKAARSHVYKLRQTKAAVEKTRKQEKADSLEYGRRVDSEAKEIISELEKMIDIHARPIEEIENRERERKQKHIDHIEGMKAIASQVTRQDGGALNSDDYKSSLNYLESFDISDMEEFKSDAAIIRDESIKIIKCKLSERIKYEEDQAELERLRIEQELKKQKERDEKIKKEAEDRAKAEHEEKIKLEKQASERRELELQLEIERAKKEKAEAERAAVDAAEKARKQAEYEESERKRKEKEEAEKREADRKHRGKINREAMQSFMDGGMSEDDAKLAVELIAKKSIKHVLISY